jgi:hypothetical protein
MNDLSEAIVSLRPGCVWSMSENDHSTLFWHEANTSPAPTLDEVNAELERLNAVKSSNQYQKSRASEYPEIADQLDMLWHSMDSGEIPKSAAFYSAIKTIKDKYPKG